MLKSYTSTKFEKAQTFIVPVCDNTSTSLVLTSKPFINLRKSHLGCRRPTDSILLKGPSNLQPALIHQIHRKWPSKLAGLHAGRQGRPVSVCDDKITQQKLGSTSPLSSSSACLGKQTANLCLWFVTTNQFIMISHERKLVCYSQQRKPSSLLSPHAKLKDRNISTVSLIFMLIITYHKPDIHDSYHNLILGLS